MIFLHKVYTGQLLWADHLNVNDPVPLPMVVPTPPDLGQEEDMTFQVFSFLIIVFLSTILSFLVCFSPMFLYSSLVHIHIFPDFRSS